MGLIKPQYIDVILGSSNAAKLDALGYDVPKYSAPMCKGRDWRYKLGETISINVEDLAPQTHKKVKCICDNCGCEFEMGYITYKRSYQEHDITYCSHCINSGERNRNWNSNITDEERKIGRNYIEYKTFIKKVLARDNYTCQCCGAKGEEVHHLEGYNVCPTLRTEETNGITLCHNCHRNFHNKYGLGNNTKKQFEEWYGHTIELLKCDIEISSCRPIYCFETQKFYNGAEECAKELGFPEIQSRIYNNCNLSKKTYSVKGFHFIWKDVYDDLTEKQLQDYFEQNFTNPKFKKVVCLNTGEIFDSMSQAEKITGCDRKAIQKSCDRDCKKLASISNSGQLFIWSYYEDYKNLKPDEIKRFFVNIQKPNQKGSVVHLCTGIVYPSAFNAEHNVDAKHCSILNVCKRNTCDHFSYKDDWMFEDEYKKLDSTIKQKIIELNNAVKEAYKIS